MFQGTILIVTEIKSASNMFSVLQEEKIGRAKEGVTVSSCYWGQAGWENNND